MKVLIVGGVAGGATAAARLRRLQEDWQIVMFERGDYVSFANCGLPYYVGGVIEEEDELLLQTPESFRSRFNIDVRVHSEVTSIDTVAKTVAVLDRQTGKTYLETYDKLLLSPGSRPIAPFKGENVFTVTTVNDAAGIKAFCADGARSAVVIGGGFIGLEMAENLHAMGLSVSVVEKAEHVMPNMDGEMAEIIHKYMRGLGISVITGKGVKSVEGKTVTLEDDSLLKADAVICAIGVRPESGLAQSCGISCSERGSILVDEQMRTSAPDVFAVGDAVEIKNRVTGRMGRIPLAGPANKQARIAADVMAGLGGAYCGSVGVSILKIGTLTAASVGATEAVLEALHIDYVKSYTHSFPHATYYPGGKQMSIKLLFRPDGSGILGAQIVGYEGVDKRIDTLSAAIQAGLTVEALSNLELAYAPPYSSAKDPVNMAGYVADNIVKGLHKVFYVSDIPSLDPNTDLLVDIRTPEEFEKGTIPGAVNLPLDEIRTRFAELPKDKNLYVFCRIGLRGYLGYRQLVQLGFEHVRNLSGGYISYLEVKK